MENNVIQFTCSEQGQRLDKFLTTVLSNVSRSEAKRLINSGLVQASLQNKKIALKASTILPIDSCITVTMPPSPTIDTPMAQPIPLDILFEDAHIIVLNKAAGLVVHPAAGHTQDTLLNALLYHHPKLATLSHNRAGLVHRLDKDTSGVMVVAKTETALHSLQQQFKARTVNKLYIALVHGHPKETIGTIDVPLGRHQQNRQKFAPQQNGKKARTHYTVNQIYRGYSLLNVTIETGRTHQIRVHLAWLGYPVAGDLVYGLRKKKPLFPRQFLHASQLTFTHPTTNNLVTFKAPLPMDLQTVLETLNA